MYWEPKEGLSIPIYPLTVKEGMADFASMETVGDPEKLRDAMSNIINKTLKKGVPDATEEELESLSVEYLQDLMQVILKVNNLGEGDVDTSKIDKIKALKEKHTQ